MDLSVIIGVTFSFGMLILGYILEHGDLLSLLMLSPIVIVFGGTVGAVIISFSLKNVARIPSILLSLNKSKTVKTSQMINLLVDMSEKARKEGLLRLESEIQSPEKQKLMGPFLQKGISLAIDGVDVNKIKDIMSTEMYVEEQKMKIDISMFEAAGGYSPTLGIIGTVMGLIQVLSNMGSPEALAKSIAVAFIATLYGVSFANLLYLPIAGKLKLNLKLYQIECNLALEGILSIQAGESPTMLREKLKPFLAFDSKKKKDK